MAEAKQQPSSSLGFGAQSEPFSLWSFAERACDFFEIASPLSGFPQGKPVATMMCVRNRHSLFRSDKTDFSRSHFVGMLEKNVNRT